ncbi:unnamed protein product [Dovyalis caffra]|uniref:Aminotransferase-like plant mobile domain-containing protein n=1 Tax=Dovyalis caffra TaxID=77055 RepID=A0AAV1RRX3_9ROSI|nr:unnamed protein product [Dovyalis caffra]
MEKTKETIVEEREERMVSLTGNEKPKLRTAHFLKPSVTSSIGENTPKHPSHPNYFLPSTFEPKNIAFHGWRSPQKKWKEWVDKMVALHESTWKKAGIYEAVLSSVYQIRRNNDLLLGLAEKWCSETNTFIFPWGEATITLEDMLVAGYSVLGSPVFSPLETEELKGVERKLMEIRKELGRSKAKKTDHTSWIKFVMENNSRVEHEAFLTLWLSRFVFPSHPLNGISKHLFPVAVCLARGPRLARWHNMNSLTLLNVRLALDSEGSFRWRPYTTAMGSLSYKIYGDKEKWVRVDVELNEELKCFARCLNACELVGIGCIELYRPHRVAMRFGIDQDPPSLVERSSKTQELAWKSFDKQIKNTVLYIPSRHLKPDVT